MSLILTPPVFLDLMMLCLAWEWEVADEKFRKSLHSDQLMWHSQTGYTTVDKITRILLGLKLLTKKQKEVLNKNRALQQLVLRHVDYHHPGKSFKFSRDGSTKELLLQFDATKDLNRERMLRDMRFYIAPAGLVVAKELEPKYAKHITKASYLAEIERQEEIGPHSKRSKAAVMKRYKRDVEDDTKG